MFLIARREFRRTTSPTLMMAVILEEKDAHNASQQGSHSFHALVHAAADLAWTGGGC